MRSGEIESLQFKFPAIEGHHLVNIRDAKLMHGRAVILPNIDRVVTFDRDSCARHIWCLTDSEQRQTVVGFEVTSLAIESNAEFDNRPSVFAQRILD